MAVRVRSKKDVKKETIKALENLIKEIKNNKRILLDINYSRGVVEKPTLSWSAYREYEPTKDYYITLHFT